MCGRFAIAVGLTELQERFNAEFAEKPAWTPRYNVAPTQTVPVVLKSGLRMAAWGIDVKGRLVVNAKGETVEKWRGEHCLVPATGFYEWKNKQPFYLHGDGIFAFAGIYDGNRFVIITTTPNDVVRKVHDRMPAIMDDEQWLAGEAPLRPYTGQLSSYAVSERVNTTKHDDEKLIIPLPTLL